MHTFPFNHFSSPPPPVIEFLTDNTNTGSSPYTLSSIPFGTAEAGRLIVICVTGFRAATRNLTSCTIGGVTATINMNYGSTATQMAIASAVVPTGTSGTINLTFSGDLSDIRYSVYSIKGLSSPTPVFTDEIINTSVACTSTISPAANTAVICNAGSYTGSATYTWSGTAGVTEYSDRYYPNVTHSTAAKVFEAAASSVTITATPTAGTTNRRLQVVGWK